MQTRISFTRGLKRLAEKVMSCLLSLRSPSSSLGVAPDAPSAGAESRYQGTPGTGLDPDDETGEGAENDAREPWIYMDEEDLDDVWPEFFPTARHLALMRKLRAAARIVAPLLGLYKAVLEKTYAPSGAGYKRARDDFEALRQA